jgi:hypothetical protein
MKIGENRNSPLTDGLLKSETTRPLDVLLSETGEITDKLELSTKKGAIDQVPGKSETPPISLKSRENLHFIDKVELSTKMKPDNTAKEKTKTTSIITQERINTLLEAIRSETYNARAGFAAKNMTKSQLLDITV